MEKLNRRHFLMSSMPLPPASKGRPQSPEYLRNMDSM